MQTSLTLAKRDEQYFSFLRFACGIKNQGDEKDQISLINQFPKYQLLINRLTPLVLHYAKAAQIFDNLEVTTQACLLEETQKGHVRQIAKNQQLQQVVDWCEKAQISIILLKGTAFQNTLYSTDAPRLSNDLDLLIHNSDWQRSVQLFEQKMNYEAKKRPDVFGDLFELSFVPQSPVGDVVDLHKSLTYPLLFNLEENMYWQTSVVHPKYQSNLVRQLSPEFSLIHQAVHAFADLDFAKYNLVDSHTLINHYTIDWQALETLATQTKTRHVVFTLLQRLICVMNTPVPIALLRRLKPSRYRRWMMNKLLAPSADLEKELKPTSYRLKQLLAQYVFTDSLLNPMQFQWLYIKSAVRKICSAQPVARTRTRNN